MEGAGRREKLGGERERRQELGGKIYPGGEGFRWRREDQFRSSDLNEKIRESGRLGEGLFIILAEVLLIIGHILNA